MDLKSAVTESGAHVRITFKVHAKAKCTVVPAGYDSWRKAVRANLRSPPVRGAANRELIKEVARVLGIRTVDIKIIRGAGDNHKVVEVSGIDFNTMVGKLEAALGDSGSRID